MRGTGEAGSGGTEILVGSSAPLAEGAVRVLLSAVRPEAGGARVAVNGARLIPPGVGETHEAGGCTLSLSGFEGRDATLDFVC